MRVLKEYATLEEAQFDRTLLASEGIDAQVLDEAETVRLAVADEDAVRAWETLGLSTVLTSVPRNASSPLWMILAIGAAVFTVLYAGLRRNHGPALELGNRTEQDRNQDGKPDERLERDQKNAPVTGYGDDNYDGRWDRRSSYQGGILARAERDFDFDGAFDSLLEYQNGVVITETIRPGGEGYPLFRHEFQRGILALTWSDKDRDGRWDERIEYDPMGREIQRTALK